MKTVIFLLLAATVFIRDTSAHPIHVSVTNIDYVVDSGKIDLSVKLYSEDFQTLINHKYNTLLNFTGQKRMTTKEQNAVVNYISENLSVMAASEVIDFKFTGWKTDHESVWLLFCAYCDVKSQVFTVRNTIFLDLFTDQVNLVILHAGDIQEGYDFNRWDTIYTFGK